MCSCKSLRKMASENSTKYIVVFKMIQKVHKEKVKSFLCQLQKFTRSYVLTWYERPKQNWDRLQLCVIWGSTPQNNCGVPSYEYKQNMLHAFIVHIELNAFNLTSKIHFCFNFDFGIFYGKGNKSLLWPKDCSVNNFPLIFVIIWIKQIFGLDSTHCTTTKIVVQLHITKSVAKIKSIFFWFVKTRL